MTIDAAWQIFEEDQRGSIENGKIADFAILNRNPLQASVDLNQIQVEKKPLGTANYVTIRAVTIYLGVEPKIYT